MTSRWCNKNDVMRDLAKTLGLKMDKLDDGIFVIGDRPPPPPAHEEDDMISQFYGAGDAGEPVVKPDLQGITQYLRMVEEYERRDEEKKNCDSLTPPNQIICLSKPNPTCKEFVPNNLNSSYTTDSETSHGVSNSCSKFDNSSPKTTRPDSRSGGSGKIDLQSAKKQNIKDVADLLKTKIKENSKKDFVANKARNVAIARLLELYSTPTTQEPKVNDEPPVLITPDYFLNDEQDDHLDEVVDETKLTPDFEETSLIDKADKVTDKAIERNDSYEVSINCGPSEREKRTSINKVNNWLNNTTNTEVKPNAPSVFLNQFAFKRKDISSSGKSSVVENKILKPTQNDCAQFQPSKYAEDLAKTYEERQKKKTESKCIWTKLEADLKARDAAIKAKNSEL